MSQPRAARPWRCFATTAPGLEPFLADELRALGFDGVKPGHSGVAFAADRDGLVGACLELRTAHRVLWTLGDVDARDRDALYRGTRAVARWAGLIPPDKTLAVFATTRDAPVFRDSRIVALTVKDAIVDAVREARGARPSVDVADPDVVVRVAVKGARGVVSLDGAGRTSLHARGYRVDAGEAPLRETLAAAMIMASGWDGRAPLVDPMCGSGTLLIEAGHIAKRVAPGLVRLDHGFERWPGHRRDRLLRLRTALQARTVRARPLLQGFDVDEAALSAARGNAERAGISGSIGLALGDVRSLDNPAPRGAVGVVVSNPPYGHRLGDDGSARRLLEALGARLRAGFAGWTCCLVLPRSLEGAVGLPIGQRWPTRSGDLEVAVVRYRVPRGG